MAELTRFGDAVWQGDLRGGGGTVSTGSGAVRGQAYSFHTRFENEPGTNPEELIAAAHAACYSMALSAGLSRAGFTPDSIRTHAILTMEQDSGGWSVTRVRLEVEGKVPNIDAAAFQREAEEAKRTCPVSRLLAPGLKSIDLTATLK